VPGLAVTAKQSRDMKASIAAAEEANRLSRENFSASQRPWITLLVEVDDATAVGLVAFAP